MAIETSSKTAYAIMQPEIGGNCKYFHGQGYWRGKGIVRPGVIQEITQGYAWISNCKGSEEKNITYCSKKKTRIGMTWSIGIPHPEIGKRLDVIADKITRKQIVILVKQGISMKPIMDNNPPYFLSEKNIKT